MRSGHWRYTSRPSFLGLHVWKTNGWQREMQTDWLFDCFRKTRPCSSLHPAHQSFLSFHFAPHSLPRWMQTDWSVFKPNDSYKVCTVLRRKKKFPLCTDSVTLNLYCGTETVMGTNLLWGPWSGFLRLRFQEVAGSVCSSLPLNRNSLCKYIVC